MRTAGLAGVLASVLMAGCVGGDAGPTTTSQGSEDSITSVFSGIDGRLVSDGGIPLGGQIVVWGIGQTPPTTTATTQLTMPGRPTAASDVEAGDFSLDLDPGWYRVRGTRYLEDVLPRVGVECGEVMIVVEPGRRTPLIFVC